MSRILEDIEEALFRMKATMRGEGAGPAWPTLEELRWRMENEVPEGRGMRPQTMGLDEELLGAAMDAITPIPLAALGLKPGKAEAVEFLEGFGRDISGWTDAILRKYGARLADTPAFKARELASEAGTKMPRITPHERPAPSVPELHEGQVLVPLLGDVTSRGDVIHEVGGIPLTRDVTTEGGPGFAQAHEGTGYGWASMKPAAASKQSNVRKAAEATGKEPVLVYSAMQAESPDFSTMPAEVAARMLPNLPIPPQAYTQFNEAVRKEFPEFVGAEEKGLLEQLMERESGELRKKFVKTMATPTYQWQGFPDIALVRQAVTDPAFHGQYEHGASGMSVIRGLPGKAIGEDIAHKTYTHGIPGEFMGSFGNLDPHLVFPDLMRSMAGRRRDEQMYNLMRSHLWQPVTEELLANLARTLGR